MEADDRFRIMRVAAAVSAIAFALLAITGSNPWLSVPGFALASFATLLAHRGLQSSE